MSSWSIDGVCAVVNMACGILEGEFANKLRNRLRQGYPAGYLDLAQAYSALQTSIQHGRLQTSDTEYARLMFLVKQNLQFIRVICNIISNDNIMATYIIKHIFTILLYIYNYSCFIYGLGVFK